MSVLDTAKIVPRRVSLSGRIIHSHYLNATSIEDIADLSNPYEAEEVGLDKEERQLFNIDSYIKSHGFKSIFEVCEVQLQSNYPKIACIMKEWFKKRGTSY